MFALSCSSVYIWFSCSSGGIVDLMFGDMNVLRADHQSLAVSDFDFSFSASFSLSEFLVSRIMLITSLRKVLNFAQCSFRFVFLTFLNAHFRFRICRLIEEVSHGGSKGLTRICLFGIHSPAIALIVAFKLFAYLFISSSCRDSQSKVDAFCRSRL